MGFSENLRYVLHQYRVDYAYLAEEVQLSASEGRKWSDGKVPTLDIIQKIVEYFKVLENGRFTVDWFLHENELDWSRQMKHNPLDWKPKKQIKKRRCLNCEKMFNSREPSERRCERCRRLVKEDGLGSLENYRSYVK
jgi:hypothetical protein